MPLEKLFWKDFSRAETDQIYGLLVVKGRTIMNKTILITGATDGIGLETAAQLVRMGHKVLLHGRNRSKLDATKEQMLKLAPEYPPESYVADLADISAVESLATQVAEQHKSLDVLINNAGVYKTNQAIADNGLDVRFVVNTLAPYLLTQKLLPLMGANSRIINLSSAAQAAVDCDALVGKTRLADGAAYAQSKLALTMWSLDLARSLTASGPSVIAVNPGSMLGTKMVKGAYGVSGADIGIGADILVRLALSDEFEAVSGRYYDNDSRGFANPHADALNHDINRQLVGVIDRVLASLKSS